MCLRRLVPIYNNIFTAEVSAKWTDTLEVFICRDRAYVFIGLYFREALYSSIYLVFPSL